MRQYNRPLSLCSAQIVRVDTLLLEQTNELDDDDGDDDVVP